MGWQPPCPGWWHLVWHAACPPTPTPCPGRAERLLLPVSISKLGVGEGKCWVPPGPCVLCHLGLVPHACSLEGPRLLFLLPFCSLELGDYACLAPIFLLASSPFSFFPVMAHHFGISSPAPSHRRQFHFQTFHHCHCWLSSLVSCLGARASGARQGGTKGFWVLLCVFRGHMLQANLCRLPRGWQSGAAEKGGRENVGPPPISDGLSQPAGCVSLWATRRPGWAFLPQPRACTFQREATSVGCPIPSRSSSHQGFKIPALLPRARVGNQAPRWALVPPEGQGTSEEPVYCPPPPPSLLPAPLSALNKVC